MAFWKNYSQIFLDWNGTLLDDAQICVDIMNECLKKRDLPFLEMSRYLDIFEFPVINYYRNLGFDLEKESFKDVGLEFIQAYQTRMFECSLHANVREFLSENRECGRKQCILSALQEGTLHKVLEHFELEPFFSEVRGSGDHYAWGKVEIGREMLKTRGKPGEKTLMIGDTTHDFETARAIGIDCVLIASGHNSMSRLEACGVPVFSSLREFAQIDTPLLFPPE